MQFVLVWVFQQYPDWDHHKALELLQVSKMNRLSIGCPLFGQRISLNFWMITTADTLAINSIRVRFQCSPVDSCVKHRISSEEWTPITSLSMKNLSQLISFSSLAIFRINLVQNSLFPSNLSYSSSSSTSTSVGLGKSPSKRSISWLNWRGGKLKEGMKDWMKK